MHHTGRVSGDPHPGNYLLLDDGRVGFLDFGLMRVLDRDYLDREASVAVAVDAGDAPRVHAVLAELGYLPEPDDVRARGADGAGRGDGGVVPDARARAASRPPTSPS